MARPRRTQERIPDSVIVNHIRRFGPLTTPQIVKGLGMSPRNVADRLRNCEGIQHDGTLDRGMRWRFVGGE